jgi:hypothetical protein
MTLTVHENHKLIRRIIIKRTIIYANTIQKSNKANEQYAEPSQNVIPDNKGGNLLANGSNNIQYLKSASL